MNKTEKEVIDFLSKMPLFSGMTLKGIEEFYKVCTRKTYGYDQRIFYQDDPASELFIILEGEVQILLEPTTIDATSGEMVNPKIVSTLAPGDSFGELAILIQSKRTATAKSSAKRTILLGCETSVFEQYCLQHRQDGIKMIFNVSQKLSNLLSINNKFILDQYVASHVAYVFKDLFLSIDPDKNLINPYERSFEISENANFLLAHRPLFSQFNVSKERFKLALFAEDRVLKKLSADREPDVATIITALLKSIRFATDFEMEGMLITGGQSEEKIDGKIIINKNYEGQIEKIVLDWKVKGMEYDSSTQALSAFLYIFIYQEEVSPEKALENYIYYTKMPVQEHVVSFLKEKTSNRDANVLVLHHRTIEIVQTLVNLKKLGFTLEAYIGIPYGQVDRAATRILDYASGGQYYTLNTVTHPYKPVEYVFDFDFSSQFSLTVEEEIKRIFNGLSDRSYLGSMSAIVSYVLEKVMRKSLINNKPLIVLEDGGYVFPIFCEAYSNSAHPLHHLVKALLEQGLIRGIVEGTASGEVRDLRYLSRLKEEQKTIFPLFSGARDLVKTVYESKGIASAIINSIAIAFRNLGIKGFETRKIAVIGGNGVIGTRLVEQLALAQGTTKNISSIDTKEQAFFYSAPEEYRNLREHIFYKDIQRYHVEEKDIILSDAYFDDKLSTKIRNNLDKLKPNARLILLNSYDQNEEEIDQHITSAVDDKEYAMAAPKKDEDAFYGWTLEKQGSTYHVLFLKKSLALQFDSAKTAVLNGVDTFIGCTGFSVFSEADLDAFFFRGAFFADNEEMVLVSGSSKDTEFKKAIVLLNEIIRQPEGLTEEEALNSLEYFRKLYEQKLTLLADKFFHRFFKNKNFQQVDFSQLKWLGNKFNISAKNTLLANALLKVLKDKLSDIINIRKEHIVNVGTIYYVEVNNSKKRIVLLADGLVVNFYAPYFQGASLEYVDPVLTLQLMGIDHLSENKRKGGFYRILPELRSDAAALWSALDSQLH